MYITCIYLHISGGLNPGESFWRPPALYDMWPHSTSRLHFCNIDRGPENVPPPTTFSRFLLPTSLQLINISGIVWSVSNQFTDRWSTGQMQVQPLHVHMCFPCWGEGRHQSPLRPVTHLSGWREAGCPAQDDVLAQGVQM